MRRALVALASLLCATPAAAYSQKDAARWERGSAAYAVRHDYATARAIFDTLVALDSAARVRGETPEINYGNPYLMRSAARRHLGDMRGADADLDRAIALIPQLGSRDYVTGILLRMDQDWTGALAAFDRAVRADPDNGEVLRARAEVRAVLRDSSGSLADMRAAADLGDTVAQSRLRPRVPLEVELRQRQAAYDLMRRGAERRDSGTLESARATFDSAVRTSRYPRAFAERGKLRARLGDTTGAMADLDSALARKPPLSMALLARGRLRAALADRRGASSDLGAAMAFDYHNPIDPEGAFDRGMLRIALGDENGGMADVSAAAEMGWANAQRVVAGLRPVPTESLNATYNRERDERDERAAVPPARATETPVTVTPFVDSLTSPRRLLLIAAALSGLLVLAGAAFGAWFALTPASQVVRFQMASGERQLWVGTPVQGVVRPRVPVWGRWSLSSFVVLVALIWFFQRAYLAVLVALIAFSGIRFVARIFLDARRRRITTYALTSRRAIVSVGNDVQSAPVEALRAATLTEHGDGTSSIEWASAKTGLQRALDDAIASGRRPSSIDVQGIIRAARGKAGAFSRIPDGSTVFRKIQEAVETAGGAGATGAPATAAAVAREDVAGEAVNEDAPQHNDPKGALLFFAAFLLIGLALGYFVAYPAVSETLAARAWVMAPCTILRSEVRTSTSGGSTGSSGDDVTYDASVRYKYHYRGRTYYGDRYQISPMSQGGIGAYNRIARRVAAIPAGSEATCWINPAHPDDAVIERGVTGGLLLRVGIAALFTLVGILGFVFLVPKTTAIT